MSYRDLAFSVVEIEVFLRGVDRHLSRGAHLVILGGGAAAFHCASMTTMDLDAYQALDQHLKDAIEAAAAETGMKIPVCHASIADIPYEAESRFERRLPELEQLQVFILEKHDLALSKIMRYAPHDEQHVIAIHETVGLDRDVLVQRFIDEMTHVMGYPPRIRAQFLQMIDRLFSDAGRATAEKALRAHGR